MKLRTTLTIGLVCLALTALVAYWRYTFWHENRFDRPIVRAAERYGVDPALVKAVVWQESRFRPHARGDAGELGLMQVRDLAAVEWAGAERVRNFDVGHLLDPGTNTLAGTWYLARLLRRYTSVDDPLPYALADYNAGRTHVLRWKKGSAETNAVSFVSQITFPSTRHYIGSVLDRHKRYQARFKR